ncbi:hypothetical protein ABZ901_00460 [Actinacidiphila alni]|uniref:hypothetical protein n=1 Tax=Actinacidiphila alni TaxID=380248 RepID=UPI0033CBC380
MTGTYDELPGFEHVLLEDSYVLDIEARPGALALRLDLLLLPGHPEHRPPRPGERACFRNATLVFRDVRDLHWTGQGTPPSRDADGTPDHGCVDALTRTGADAYRLEGDWGGITVASAPPALLIHPGPGQPTGRGVSAREDGGRTARSAAAGGVIPRPVTSGPHG